MTTNVSCDIETDRKWAVSYFYYKEPAGWHKNIHKRSGTVYENIEDTLSSISEVSVMYVLRVDNDPAGFFVKYENSEGTVALEGFHVGVKYRTPEFLSQFWAMVKENLGPEILTGIYEKNKQALDHLLKQGFRIENSIEEKGKLFYILKFKL